MKQKIKSPNITWIKILISLQGKLFKRNKIEILILQDNKLINVISYQ